MPVRILTLIAALAASLALASTAGASPTPRHPAPLEQASLTATTTMGTWESRPVGGTVFVHLTSHGHPLRQRGSGGACTALFSNRWTVVKVTIPGCQGDGGHPVRLRFGAFAGAVRMQVVLARS